MSRCERLGRSLKGVGWSRLATGAVLVVILLGFAAQAGQGAWARGGFGAAYKKITGKPEYRYSSWGILVKDLSTGKVLFTRDAEHQFLPGSTVRSFTSLAAMDALGAGHRFETPVYAVGPIDPTGRLEGDLVLVARGDPTSFLRLPPAARTSRLFSMPCPSSGSTEASRTSPHPGARPSARCAPRPARWPTTTL